MAAGPYQAGDGVEDGEEELDLLGGDKGRWVSMKWKEIAWSTGEEELI